ncbi:MAG: hypothetical protein LKH27_06985 [Prevotella sp.]|jgi:hypothetical protein|nr:hypothetical protein [Prevotella sp.]MCI1474136.1 hypothetical protein [Prevotella sp.]MCI1518987.1 hypothetical protein [Prevotella sp.]MCI1549788.1 hypothetical protein [Prevotella sp.]
MKLKSRTNNSEPEDAREAFHKSEKQHARQAIINKWLSRLFVLIAIAIIAFALYAYFIDKPGAINGQFTSHP